MSTPDPTELPPIVPTISDYDLDEWIACAQARRDVARAHRREATAAGWHDLLVKLADIRADRRRLAENVEDAMLPTILLGELPDDDES